MHYRDKIKQANRERYLEESKRRLDKIIEKHMTTTFIAALAEVESTLGFLWNHGNQPRDTQEREFYDLYQKVRNAILNRGNHELRAVKNELEQYTIDWNRYQTKFIVTQPPIREEKE
jgi:hypothetical protein